ncbi:MAG: aldehyde dehydrogenase family protein, partial [Actinomycetia bacterium]|nr:aldehyde dehydrogenase family protein [Actinomycetes bacterium]
MSLTLPATVRTQAYIGGQFVDSLSGETFDSLAPAIGQVITRIAACAEGDVDRAVASARAAFESGVWSKKSPAERKVILMKLADLIEENAEELAVTESIDAGKPITECRTFDIPDVVNTMRWYAELADKVFGKISPTGPDALGMIVREPIGVVGAVLPWNFPAAMLAWKLGPALAAGNSIVVKPAELSSLTTLRIAELASQAGVPDGVFNVITGLGHVAGKALGLHMDVDLIAFTGSTEVGRFFLQYSAQSNMKEIVLEMGGKSPQIVMPDCVDKIDTIAAELAEGSFWNTGQNCSAGSRILVHNSIRTQIVEALAKVANSRVVGDPSDPDTALGPVIEEAALDRILGYVAGAKKQGAEVACGGEQLFEETGGWFVGPTILNGVTPDMTVAQEEIFGPVVSVIGFDTEEEAIELANGTEYGLAAVIYTDQLETAIRMARA